MKADLHPELTRQYEPQRERCKPLTCTGNESCWVKRGVVSVKPGNVGPFFDCCAGPPATPREYTGPRGSGGGRVAP